jgi:hypothetical protein
VKLLGRRTFRWFQALFRKARECAAPYPVVPALCWKYRISGLTGDCSYGSHGPLCRGLLPRSEFFSIEKGELLCLCNGRTFHSEHFISNIYVTVLKCKTLTVHITILYRYTLLHPLKPVPPPRQTSVQPPNICGFKLCVYEVIGLRFVSS